MKNKMYQLLNYEMDNFFLFIFNSIIISKNILQITQYFINILKYRKNSWMFTRRELDNGVIMSLDSPINPVSSFSIESFKGETSMGHTTSRMDPINLFFSMAWKYMNRCENQISQKQEFNGKWKVT